MQSADIRELCSIRGLSEMVGEHPQVGKANIKFGDWFQAFFELVSAGKFSPSDWESSANAKDVTAPNYMHLELNCTGDVLIRTNLQFQDGFCSWPPIFCVPGPPGEHCWRQVYDM